MYILTTLEFPTHNIDFHLLTTSVNAKYYYYSYLTKAVRKIFHKSLFLKWIPNSLSSTTTTLPIKGTFCGCLNTREQKHKE